MDRHVESTTNVASKVWREGVGSDNSQIEQLQLHTEQLDNRMQRLETQNDQMMILMQNMHAMFQSSQSTHTASSGKISKHNTIIKNSDDNNNSNRSRHLDSTGMQQQSDTNTRQGGSTLVESTLSSTTVDESSGAPSTSVASMPNNQIRVTSSTLASDVDLGACESALSNGNTLDETRESSGDPSTSVASMPKNQVRTTSSTLASGVDLGACEGALSNGNTLEETQSCRETQVESAAASSTLASSEDASSDQSSTLVGTQSIASCEHLHEAPERTTDEKSGGSGLTALSQHYTNQPDESMQTGSGNYIPQTNRNSHHQGPPLEDDGPAYDDSVNASHYHSVVNRFAGDSKTSILSEDSDSTLPQHQKTPQDHHPSPLQLPLHQVQSILATTLRRYIPKRRKAKSRLLSPEIVRKQTDDKRKNKHNTHTNEERQKGTSDSPSSSTSSSELDDANASSPSSENTLSENTPLGNIPASLVEGCNNRRLDAQKNQQRLASLTPEDIATNHITSTLFSLVARAIHHHHVTERLAVPLLTTIPDPTHMVVWPLQLDDDPITAQPSLSINEVNDAIHFEILKREVDWDSTDGIKIFDAKRLTLVVNVIISARHFWFRDEHSNPVDRKLMTPTHIVSDYERVARSLSRTKHIMKDV